MAWLAVVYEICPTKQAVYHKSAGLSGTRLAELDKTRIPRPAMS